MKSTPDERELLIAQAAGAHRWLDAQGAVQPHPAWLDLDDAGRLEAYEEARRQRLIESALSPDGLSTTGQAVLRLIRGG
jgi:hypothetical protein